MRSKLVFVVLVLLFAGIGWGVFVRARAPHSAPPLPAAAASDAGAREAAAPAAAASPDVAKSDAGAKVLLGRTLRVAGLGWETIAPSVLAPKDASLDVATRGIDKLESLEGALARGGEDAEGADVAVLPLPSFVAAYERLRALSPQIFFVAGWSRGREALYSSKNPLASTTPLAGDVKLSGLAAEPATWFGVSMLDLAGASGEQIKIVPPTTKVDDVALLAIDRSRGEAPSGAKLRVTTADAARLVPLVAIAQRGTIEKYGPVLVTWTRGFLEGARILESDATTSARSVSAVQGAPEPIALLRRLGELAPSSIADNARTVGLSGRSAVTVETLFQRAWQHYRGAGILATPPPESAPVNTAVIAAIVRADPSLAQNTVEAKKSVSAQAAKKVLLVHRIGTGAAMTDAQIASSVGFVAGVFDHSPLRVTVHGGGAVDAKRTQKIIDAVQGQFDVSPGRLVAGTKAFEKSTASVEVLDL